MSKVITGLIRVRLHDLAKLPKAMPRLAVEVDIGIDWPNAADLSQLTYLAWRSDRLIVSGSNAAAVIYAVQYLEERIAADTAGELVAADQF